MATKTIFMKKLVFWTLSIFTAFLWSCEDTELHESHSENKNEISIEQFKEETGITDFPKTLKIPKNSIGLQMRGRDTINTDDFEIDWSVVKRTAINERYTYSFRVLPYIIKSKSIFNLVVYYDLDRWQYSLIEFFPTQTNWDALVAGTTKVIEGGLREVYNTVALNRTITIKVPTEYHCTHPGNCDPDGGCDLCINCVTWGSTITVDIPDEIVQIIAPIPGSGGGGGSGSPFTNPFPTINDPRGFIFAPNLFAPGDLAFSRISRSQEFWNSLDYQQKEWANSNEFVYVDMISKLLLNFNNNNVLATRELIAFMANKDENQNDFGKKLKLAIASGITSTAELIHTLYKECAEIIQQYPSSLPICNAAIDTTVAIVAEPLINTNPANATWTGLFMMWLMEIGENPYNVTAPSYLITTLQNQQGVTEARTLAFNNILNGNTNPVNNHPWTYGQQAFYDGMADGNVVTSFLGSYNTSVSIQILSDGRKKLTFTVNNPSSWESATRLRIDNDGNGIHDGIFPNHSRGSSTSLHLGGNWSQVFSWSEIYQ